MNNETFSMLYNSINLYFEIVRNDLPEYRLVSHNHNRRRGEFTILVDGMSNILSHEVYSYSMDSAKNKNGETCTNYLLLTDGIENRVKTAVFRNLSKTGKIGICDPNKRDNLYVQVFLTSENSHYLLQISGIVGSTIYDKKVVHFYEFPNLHCFLDTALEKDTKYKNILSSEKRLALNIHAFDTYFSKFNLTFSENHRLIKEFVEYVCSTLTREDVYSNNVKGCLSRLMENYNTVHESKISTAIKQAYNDRDDNSMIVLLDKNKNVVFLRSFRSIYAKPIHHAFIRCIVDLLRDTLFIASKEVSTEFECFNEKNVAYSNITICEPVIVEDLGVILFNRHNLEFKTNCGIKNTTKSILENCSASSYSFSRKGSIYTIYKIHNTHFVYEEHEEENTTNTFNIAFKDGHIIEYKNIKHIAQLYC